MEQQHRVSLLLLIPLLSKEISFSSSLVSDCLPVLHETTFTFSSSLTQLDYSSSSLLNSLASFLFDSNVIAKADAAADAH